MLDIMCPTICYHMMSRHAVCSQLMKLTVVSSTLQLLSQAARNMVIQEDAILHSEDVSDIHAKLFYL